MSLDGHAFDGLTPAQKLVYDTPHLSNTDAGQRINYRYRSQLGDTAAVSDRVLLSVNKTHVDDRRDVVLDFLSDERRMHLPDFSGYRGNPVIIAMLEHIAQSLGRETGGGVLYFRNRIRDALSQADNRIDRITVRVGQRSVEANRLHFLPFVRDQYLADKPALAGAEFSIVVSDDVPGGVVAVEIRSSRDSSPIFDKEIVIE